jgi:hypothetical protein
MTQAMKKKLLYNHDRNGLEVTIGSGLDIKKIQNYFIIMIEMD